MKCPHCEADFPPPKSNYSKNIYTKAPCCKKPIRFIPHLSWSVTKDRADQAAKSAEASLSLRRTNLIKRVIKDTIQAYVGLKFISCIARPVQHPDGREAYKLDGIIEYLIMLRMPDTISMHDISNKLEMQLHRHGIDVMCTEHLHEEKYQFRISISKAIPGEKE